jgi:hypothetical protein
MPTLGQWTSNKKIGKHEDLPSINQQLEIATSSSYLQTRKKKP